MTNSFVLRRKATGELLKQGSFTEQTGIKVLCNQVDSLPVADVVFRWGCTGDLPGDPKVINSARAIHRVNDKKGFRSELLKEGLCPPTWFSLEEYLVDRPQGLVGKLLVRPASHSRSDGMFVCTDLRELVESIKAIQGAYYISDLIDKKREYRVFVAQNRVAWMIEKLPKNKDEISWGCVEEGTFKYVGWSDWPLDVVDVALRSMRLSKLHFGAVDIIVSSSGHPYVLEINTAPHLTPYYMKTVGKVFKYIRDENQDRELPDAPLEWKSVIHPAVKDF